MSWTFTGKMKEDNDSQEDMHIIMRIEDEKEESEEIKEKNDENTGIGKALMNTKSDIIVLD